MILYCTFFFFFLMRVPCYFCITLDWLDWLGLVRMEHGGEYWRVCLILIGTYWVDWLGLVTLALGMDAI